eukprot:gene12231-12369_t
MLDDLAAAEEVEDTSLPLWAQPIRSARKHVASSLGSFKTALSCAVTRHAAKRAAGAVRLVKRAEAPHTTEQQPTDVGRVIAEVRAGPASLPQLLLKVHHEEEALPDTSITSLQEEQEVHLQAAQAAAPQIAAFEAVSEVFAADRDQNAQDRAAALLQLQNQKSAQPALAPQEKQQLLAMARQREQQAAAEVEEREAAFRALGEDGWADWFQDTACQLGTDVADLEVEEDWEDPKILALVANLQQKRAAEEARMTSLAAAVCSQ